MRHRTSGTASATWQEERVAVSQPFPFTPPPPPRLRPDWSTWVVIAAILLLVAFALYLYAG